MGTKIKTGRTWSEFGRGGCFTCDTCGRKTRETGENAGLDGLCPLCAELLMLQNGFSDYGGSEGDRELSLSLRKEIIRRGGKVTDHHTWAEEDPLPLDEWLMGFDPLSLCDRLFPKDQSAAVATKPKQVVSEETREKLRQIAKAAWAPGGCLHKKFKS
jgi:hypothetical protein